MVNAYPLQNFLTYIELVKQLLNTSLNKEDWDNEFNTIKSLHRRTMTTHLITEEVHCKFVKSQHSQYHLQIFQYEKSKHFTYMQESKNMDTLKVVVNYKSLKSLTWIQTLNSRANPI